MICDLLFNKIYGIHKKVMAFFGGSKILSNVYDKTDFFDNHKKSP